MRLKTLGTIALEGATFRRTLPLIVLSYLSLEGPKDRRHLADLFWPGASDSLNCLSVTLSRLRRDAPGVMGADDTHVWSTVPSDAQQVLSATEDGQFEKGLALYQGCFLEGFYLRTQSPEVEEWVYYTREFLAYSVRNGLLELANARAACGQYKDASKLAEKAYLLPGAPALEPVMLEQLYRLLVAGSSFQAYKVRKEAADYGLTLTASMQTAKEQCLKEHLKEQGLTPPAVLESTAFSLERPNYRAV